MSAHWENQEQMDAIRCRIVPAVSIAMMGIAYWSDPALAAGFALREGATDWMANGYAGETAKAYDASAAFANPAGMVRLDQTEIDVGVDGIFPTVHFSGNDLLNRTPVSGTIDGNHIQYAAIAAQFGIWSYSPDLKFGFAVTTPSGQRTVYETQFVGRYQALVSSITDFNVTLSAAYRVNDHFSIGVGPVIDYLEARLTQALNLGPFGDAYADVRGQSVAAGFNIGLLYQFNPGTRIGVDYRSRIERNNLTVGLGLSAPALQQPSPALAAAIAAQSTTAKTSFILPDNVSIGLYHQIDRRWAVMADAQWTDWSLLHNITIAPRNGTPPVVIPENWHNAVFVAIGASYRATEKLLLQAGIFYDESPVNAGNWTSRIPDANRYGCGIGFTYTALKNIDLQAAYSHQYFVSGTINQTTSPTAGTLRGSYNISDDSISAGITIRF